MYDAATKRQARRLGVVLPTTEPDSTPSEWSSDGHDDLFVGPCLLTYGQGGWTVKLRRSGRKGGYRRVQTGMTLPLAVELAEFLRKPENRRAYRGLRPRGEAAKVVTYDDLVEDDAKAALREQLAKVNGGAVEVR